VIAHPCLQPPVRGPALPAAIVAVDDCGAFLAREDGRVERLPRHWLARHSSWTGRVYGPKLQVRFVRRRLELRVDERAVWRAARVYPDYGGSLAFGPHDLFAFTTFKRGLFLASRPGRERLVVRGRGLYPIGFTPRGDVLVALPRSRIWLVDAGGHVLLRIRYRARNGFAFDERTGTLTWISRRRRLAQLVDRRFALRRRLLTDGWLQLEPAGLLGFVGLRSLLVTSADGSRVASATVARGTIDSGVTGSPDGSRFAFRVRLGAARVGAPVEVYVLRAGGSVARRLLRYRLRAVGCGGGAGYGWDGDALLYYGAEDTRQIAIDTRSGRVTDLSRLVRVLPRRGPYANLAWRSAYS
jgi:hypothetical protein